MGSLRKRRGRTTRRTFVMLTVEVVVLVLAVSRFRVELFPSTITSDTAPTPAQALTRRDVLPTPTPDTSTPPRLIVFPSASISAPIIPAGRVQGTWETRHLGDSVGHLVGTSWLDGPGSNIVLAGHVESATGEPGPFAYLFQAHLGDTIILRDGTREQYYKVTLIEEVQPDDVSYVAQSGNPRMTLITCTDWDFESNTYLGRLVVIAEPVVSTAQQ
jgi:sortase A